MAATTASEAYAVSSSIAPADHSFDNDETNAPLTHPTEVKARIAQLIEEKINRNDLAAPPDVIRDKIMASVDDILEMLQTYLKEYHDADAAAGSPDLDPLLQRARQKQRLQFQLEQVVAHTATAIEYATANGQDDTIWICTPDNGMGLGIRTEPFVDGARRPDHINLQPGEHFRVSQIKTGTDGVLYLKLADGRGWVFDRKSFGDTMKTMCRRVAEGQWAIDCPPPMKPNVGHGSGRFEETRPIDAAAKYEATIWERAIDLWHELTSWRVETAEDKHASAQRSRQWRENAQYRAGEPILN